MFVFYFFFKKGPYKPPSLTIISSSLSLSKLPLFCLLNFLGFPLGEFPQTPKKMFSTTLLFFNKNFYIFQDSFCLLKFILCIFGKKISLFQ